MTVFPGATVSVSQTSFINNLASAVVNGGNVVVSDCDFRGNQTSLGTGVRNFAGGKATIEGSRLIDYFALLGESWCIRKATTPTLLFEAA